MSEELESTLIEQEEPLAEEECVKPSKKDKDTGACIDQSNPRYQNKMPLVMYLLSIAVAIVAGVLLALDNGATDLSWSQGIYDWARAPGNETLLTIFGGMVALIGGQLAFIITGAICLIIWIMSFGNSKRSYEAQKVRKILKYAAIIVLSALISVALNFLLKGIFARAPPSAGDFTAWYVIGSNPDPWVTGSFPSDLVTYATVLLGMSFWFNTKKTFVYKILVTLLVGVYVIFMVLSVVAMGKAYLSDAVLGAIFTYWVVALVAKGILAIKEQELFDVYMRVRLPFNKAYNKMVLAKEALNLEAVPKLINKAFESYKAVYEAELARVEKTNATNQSDYEKAKAKASAGGLAEPEKPEEVTADETIVSNYNLLESATKLTLNELVELKDVLSKIEADGEIDEAKTILADNKSYAMDLMNKSLEEFKEVIEKAKLEMLDFTMLINKCEIYISYLNRFIEELNVLEHTKGTAFNEYMKRNFLYVL